MLGTPKEEGHSAVASSHPVFVPPPPTLTVQIVVLREEDVVADLHAGQPEGVAAVGVGLAEAWCAAGRGGALPETAEEGEVVA